MCPCFNRKNRVESQARRTTSGRKKFEQQN